MAADQKSNDLEIAEPGRRPALDYFLPKNLDRIRDFDLILKLRTAIAIIYLIIFTSLYFIYRLYDYYGEINLFSVLLILFTALGAGSLAVLRKGGKPAPVLLATMLVFISLNIILTYHNHNGIALGLLWSFVIAIMAVFLMGPLAGGALTMVSLGGSSCLYYLSAHGHSFPHLDSKVSGDGAILFFVILLTFLVVIFTWLYEASRNYAWRLESLKNRQLTRQCLRTVEAEKALEKINLELQEVNLTLEARVEEKTRHMLESEQLLMQQAKMAAMGEMIGAIAHQWRQPLNSLALAVQDLLEAQSAGELTRDYLAESVKQSMEYIQHMSQTIDDFRSFSQPSREIEDFNIIKTILDSIKIVRSQIERHNIEIILQGMSDASEPAIVSGIPNDFKQVMLNLINNAKDAIEERRNKTGRPSYAGRILISLEREKNLKIHVEDNGEGIPENVLPHIFEPYYTTKPGVGTGIGLYMSKRIIEENMSGWLFAHNGEKGARFTVLLNIV